MARILFQLLFVGALLTGTVRPSAATFHLMKIVEVFPGTAAQPDAQYVLLEMYSPGQSLVGGHSVVVYGAAGSVAGTFTFPVGSSLPHAASQDKILLATAAAETLFGVTADLAMTAAISPAGGAVCFDVVDCVSWGTFSGTLPSLAGVPFDPTAGLSLGHVIRRDISAGNPSMLEAGDDTNMSDVDFDCADTATPINNAGVAATSPYTDAVSCPVLPTATPTTSPSPTTTPTATATPAIECPPSPDTCRSGEGGKGSFQIGNRSLPQKRKLSWKWNKGAATAFSDFGDPTVSTHFALCVYDGSGSLQMSAVIPAGSVCDGKPCWKRSGSATPSGFKYKDRDGLQGGITQIVLKAGVDGEAKVSVKGKGENLVLLALPPLQSPAPLQVQLHRSGGIACWGAAYGAPARSDPAETEKFSDRND